RLDHRGVQGARDVGRRIDQRTVEIEEVEGRDHPTVRRAIIVDSGGGDPCLRLPRRATTGGPPPRAPPARGRPPPPRAALAGRRPGPPRGGCGTRWASGHAPRWGPGGVGGGGVPRERLGARGQSPCAGGPPVSLSRGSLWGMRMFAGFATPEDPTRRFKFLLA